MESKDYQPDAVCRYLGLPGFTRDPGWRAWPVLRVLLLPSFHPEICITVMETAEETLLSVVAAEIHIYQLREPRAVVTSGGSFRLPRRWFQALAASLREALSISPPKGWAMLDGMPVHILLDDNQGTLAAGENSGRHSPFSHFVAGLIATAHVGISDEACRKRLAYAGAYAGLNLPRDRKESFEPPPEEDIGWLRRSLASGRLEELRAKSTARKGNG